MLKILFAVAVLLLLISPQGRAADAKVDRDFVAMVSEGGMFEVEASKLADDRAQAQDVKDFAVSEVHDHGLVGDKLKGIATQEGIPVAAGLDAKFSAQLDQLRGLKGAAFDTAYMKAMATIHAKDGAAFAAEAKNGVSPDLRAFAAETHAIVQRHIGAIHGASPS